MNKLTHNKGFTLVELAVSLVVIGLLIGLGTAMVGPLMTAIKVRESKETIGGVVESVNSWAAGNNRLPDTAGGTTDFKGVAKTPADAWGRDFIYLYDCRFASTDSATCTGAGTAITKDTICGQRTTAITLRQCLTANCTTTSGIDYADTPNVTHVILSRGDDASIQTTSSDAAITASRPFASGATVRVTADYNNNDIVRWVTLDELRTKVGCQGAQLRIVNNELPYLSSGSDNTAAYNASVTADGGVLSSGYRWCVQGTAISGLTFTPNIFSTDCLALRKTSETNWPSGSSITITRTPVTPPNPPYQPILSNSYSFTVYVSDNSDTSSPNDNIASKTFVLTINP